MRSLTLCCAAALLAFTSVSTFALNAQTQQVDVPSDKSINFFKRQVAANQSVENAVRSLLSHYPENTVELVKVALSAYPEKYKTIIEASVSTQPMFVDEIIRIANAYNVAAPTDIVSIAVMAEPSYAEIATSAACKYSPEHFNDIVRTAVKSEPNSADQIAQKLVTAYPNKTMEILVTTIKEVPFVGKYVLDALLAVVQEDEVKSQNMIVMSVEQLAQYPEALDRLVQLANQHNIERDTIKQSAMRGGLSETQIARLIDTYYSDPIQPD